ncbi:hypothetical protein BSAF29S_03740 [Bacillus safensis subsp. safensis]
MTYEGGTYVVNTAPPTGTPGTSPDYTLLAAAGVTGSTGPTGPTGPFLSSGVYTVATTNQVIPHNGFVVFTEGAVISGSAFFYQQGSDTITIREPGLYYASWGVKLEAGSPASAFGLLKNDGGLSPFGIDAGGGNLSSSNIIIVTTTPYTINLTNRSGGDRTITGDSTLRSAYITIIKFADGSS